MSDFRIPLKGVDKMEKHIMVIAQYFYPEQFRINNICEEWIKRGYKITVMTGIPNYPQGSYYKGYGLFKKRRENYKGIDIIRIPLVPRGRNPIMLGLNYLSFVASGFFFVKFTALKVDCVFIYEVSPMTQALPGVWFAKRKKIPCVLYVTDLWPENVEIVAGIKNKYILSIIGKMVDYIYRHCDKILASSRSFIQAIENRGVKKSKIEFWPQYAEDFYQPLPRDQVKVTEIPKDNWFNILFAGNIGYAQGLEVLPKVAVILKEKGCKVRFNLIGDGRAKNDLIKTVEINKVKDYFNFIDSQPAIQIPKFMSICDAALICLSKSKVFEITLPAKTQSCLACGVPVIVCADGEVCDVIREANAGVCSPAGNSEKLAAKIIELTKYSQQELAVLGRNAVKYYSQQFNKDKLLNRIDEIFKQEKGDIVYVYK